jgi:hypothetical protein
MKWTYQEYLEQPLWLIELIELKNNLEAEQQQKESKKWQT